MKPTPSILRIQQLSKRIDRLTHPSDNTKQIFRGDQRLQQLEQILVQSERSFQQKLNEFSVKLTKLKKDIQYESRTRKYLFEQKTVQIQHAQLAIRDSLMDQIAMRKELEGKLAQYLQEKVTQIKNQILYQSKKRNESFRTIQNYLYKVVPKFQSDLNDRLVQVPLYEDSVEIQLGNSVEELEGEVLRDKQENENKYQEFYDLVKTFVVGIKEDLEVEKKQRESSNQNFLVMLEESYLKLSFLNN